MTEEKKLSKKELAAQKREEAEKALQEECDTFMADYPEFADDYNAIYTKAYNEEDGTWEYPTLPLPVLSRQAAIKLGMKKFYTGVPCIKGHDAPRKVKGGCVACIRDRVKAKRLAKAAAAAADAE